MYINSFLSISKSSEKLKSSTDKEGLPAKKTKFKRMTLNPNDFKKVVMASQKHRQMTFDLETTSLDYFTTHLVAIVFAFPDYSSYYLRIKTKSQDHYSIIYPELKKILEDKSIKKIGHNLKFEYLVLKQCGIELKGIYFDTMLGEYLLNSNRTHFNLESIILDYFGVQKQTYSEMQGRKETIFEIDEGVLETYTFEDGEYTQLIFEKQIKSLKKKELNLMHTIEVPLIEVLGEVETNGVVLDIKALGKLSDRCQLEIDSLTLEIHQLAGKNFNINSTKELQSILFDKMAIKPLKKTKTGYSTDITVLEKLAGHYPIANALLRYRLINKLKSTYTDSLSKLIHKKTNRVHTNYNQSIAATGRLSSTHPNLQNIPIKMEEGREVRSCFVAPPGHLVASFDYSQVELRILAKLSGDKTLLDIYKNNIDIHRQTAELIFNTQNISSDERRMAKTINFSVMYGISAFALAEDLKISQKEASFFIEAYFAAYPGVKQYINKVIELARSKQYTLTYYGRKRSVPNILSSNLHQKSHAERVAFNSVIQGTASDIIKIAMIDINKSIKNSELRGEMIMQVHDELVFYIPDNEILEKQCQQIKTRMSSVEPFQDILSVNAEIGTSWNK